MIIQKETFPVEFQNLDGAEEKKLQISQSQGAIVLLIDFLSKLYSNPRQTIMFEYVQNALDSHHEAGKDDIPIEVSLPNENHPYYVVRDFGVSMSQETIENIFLRVFESMKRDSDELRGGYGVGKLVFGPYAGVMFITTWIDGFKTSYIFRLENGEGGITQINRVESDEPQGVEIKIPIKPEDFSFFKNKAKDFYSFLPTFPKIKGVFETNDVIQREIQENIFFHCEGEYTILKKPLEIFENSIATIGGLPFPVSSVNANTHYDLLSTDKIVLHFKVGEIDHTPSRDQLEYNKKTIAAIREKMNRLVDDYCREVVKKIESAATYFEAQCMYHEMYAAGGIVSKLIQSATSMEKEFSYNGQKVSPYIRLDDSKMRFVYFKLDDEKNRLLRGEVEKVSPKKDMRFIFINESKESKVKYYQKIKNFIRDNNLADKYVIGGLAFDPSITVQMMSDETGIPMDQIVDVNNDLEYVSPLKNIKRGPGPKRKILPDGVVLKNCMAYNFTDWWTGAEIDYKNGSGVYVLTSYSKPCLLSGTILEKYHGRDWIKIFFLLSGEDVPLYGIKQRDRKKMGPGWISIEEHIADCLKKQKGKIHRSINIHKASGGVSLTSYNSTRGIINELIKNYEGSVKCSTIRDCGKYVIFDNDYDIFDKEDLRSIQSFIRSRFIAEFPELLQLKKEIYNQLFHLKGPVLAETKKREAKRRKILSRYINIILKKYPLLGYLDYNRVHGKNVLDYVNLICENAEESNHPVSIP